MRTLIITLLTAGLLSFTGAATIHHSDDGVLQAQKPGGFEWDFK